MKTAAVMLASLKKRKKYVLMISVSHNMTHYVSLPMYGVNFRFNDIFENPQHLNLQRVIAGVRRCKSLPVQRLFQLYHNITAIHRNKLKSCKYPFLSFFTPLPSNLYDILLEK